MNTLSVGLLLAVTVATLSNSSALVRIKQSVGKPVEFSAARQSAIAKLTIEMLRTASYETSPAIAEERFNKARQQDYLQVSFTPAQPVGWRFSTQGAVRETTIDISAVIVPLVAAKWPDYIFVREGNKTRAFSKYHPGAAQAWRDALREF